jgi:hypothetical protein
VITEGQAIDLALSRHATAYPDAEIYKVLGNLNGKLFDYILVYVSSSGLPDKCYEVDLKTGEVK